MGKFTSSYSGVGDMLSSEEMQAEMRRRALAGKVFAEGAAPVDTGEYKASFKVESGVKQGKTRRAFGRLKNTDPAALWIELGTSDTPRHRTLGRSLDHMK